MPALLKDPPALPPRPKALHKLWTPFTVGTLTAAVLSIYPEALDSRLKSLHLLEYHLPWLRVLSSAPLRMYTLLFGFTFGFAFVKGINWLRWKALRHLFAYQGWVTNPRGFKNKLWASALRLCLPAPPYKTYQFQSILPRQPLPKLDDTLDLFLQVSKQLVKPDEFLMTSKVVEEFRRNEGPKLQRYLEERKSRTPNWLADYWMMAAYLASRQPLAVYSNYYQIQHVGPHRTSDPLARAACLVHLLDRYETCLSAQDIQPVMMQDMIPLCMHGYRYVFNTCRIPGEEMDTIQTYPGKHHIIVIRRGHYYILDLVRTDANGRKRKLTTPEIKHQLQKICQNADNEKPIPPVAALTAQNRTVWAKQRRLLSEQNQRTLDILESALYILVLDPRYPKDQHQRCKAALTGHGEDIWFDKSFTLTVYADASMGTNTEHTALDAMIFCTVSEFLMCYEEYKNGDVVPDANTSLEDLQQPNQINWSLDGMHEMINEAMKSAQKLIDDIDVFQYNPEYGKGYMKKCRMSPDGYIQMALQLAWYRMYKEFPKTYEPSTGRFYLLGRTETVHPCTKHALKWVKSMDDPRSDKGECIDLLRKAVKAQTEFRLQATVGRGCDRHLLGLYCAARELGMDLPNIFRDKAWHMPFKLSTSQTPTNLYAYHPDVRYECSIGGFGPSCHNGYGISYIILGDNVINIGLSSWNSCEETSSAQFAAAIATAMADMKKLFA